MSLLTCPICGEPPGDDHQHQVNAEVLLDRLKQLSPSQIRSKDGLAITKLTLELGKGAIEILNVLMAAAIETCDGPEDLIEVPAGLLGEMAHVLSATTIVAASHASGLHPKNVMANPDQTIQEMLDDPVQKAERDASQERTTAGFLARVAEKAAISN